MTAHRRPRIVLAGAMFAVVASSGCSASFDDGQLSFVDEDAQLLCDEGSSLALAAQSVPAASSVPCISTLPAGWSIDYSDFDHDGVEIGIDSRRAPIDDIVITFSAQCAPGADPIPITGDTIRDMTGDDGTDGTFPNRVTVLPTGYAASQDVDGLATRVVVAGGGGCTEFAISLDRAEAVTLDDFPAVEWIPRARIDAGVSEATGDRLRLDP